MNIISIKFYQVKCGDCISLAIGEENFHFFMVIDMGYAQTYHRTLKKSCKKTKVLIY